MLNHATTFVPCWLLCIVNEIVICWYNMGGKFNNEGVQHYIVQEHKLDNEAEMQDLANVLSGIILQLKIVDSDRVRPCMSMN